MSLLTGADRHWDLVEDHVIREMDLPLLRQDLATFFRDHFRHHLATLPQLL